MNATINPSTLKGNIRVPSSKSSMQRALAAALLNIGETIIHNPGFSEDDKAAMKVIEALGATIDVSKVHERSITIYSEGVKPRSNEINCGESGLSIRMFTPIACLSEKQIEIGGSGSLVNRPMNFFDEILPKLGVEVKTNQGKLPLLVKGPLVARNIEIDGSLSSQFLTGLLMAFSAADASDVGIKVNNLNSKPYIDLTIDTMKKMGMVVPENQDYKNFYFPSNKISENKVAVIHNREIQVEGDWSGASFLLVAGVIAGHINISGLDLTSSQSDKKMLDALLSSNAAVAVEAKGIKVHTSSLQSFEFDATDCPDLFPPLVALAAYGNGDSYIKGIHRLEHKESNRAVSLQQEFRKMNVEIELANDIMVIKGGKKVRGANIHSHHDHRIAMACAVAALGAEEKTVIEDAEAVRKSYPSFFEDLKKLGADVSLNNKIKLNE